MNVNLCKIKNLFLKFNLKSLLSIFLFTLVCVTCICIFRPTSATSLALNEKSNSVETISNDYLENKKALTALKSSRTVNNINLLSAPKTKNNLGNNTKNLLSNNIDSISSNTKNLISCKYNTNAKEVIHTSKFHSNTTYQIKKSSHEFLPDYFDYSDVNKEKLRAYLCKRNSLLAEEPYFSTIISTGRDFNINPLILFAITGQEQSFVPKHQKSAYKIANNPFNVFHSWMDYNTDIGDATRIACRTVINLSKGRPSYYDPFNWINKLYADDPDWGRSVRIIYNQLKNATK